jgi:hypothetical protein
VTASTGDEAKEEKAGEGDPHEDETSVDAKEDAEAPEEEEAHTAGEKEASTTEEKEHDGESKIE